MVEVIKAGLFDTIQDQGRMGMQAYGVPYSGPMDAYTATLGNAILGNAKEAAVMECTILGPQLKFQTPTRICITGALMQPRLNGIVIKNNRVILVQKNDILSFGRLEYGCRSYISVLGGFRTKLVLGSRSLYQGITPRFKLATGDQLPVSNVLDPHTIAGLATIKTQDKHFQKQDIEVFVGPEFEQLSLEQRALLFQQTYSVATSSNRMAYQFNETLPNTLAGIITSVVLPGTVQLTPSGQVMVLMRDGQTTGGYPRILQLSEEAINVLSQKPFGAKIRFKCIK